MRSGRSNVATWAPLAASVLFMCSTIASAQPAAGDPGEPIARPGAVIFAMALPAGGLSGSGDGHLLTASTANLRRALSRGDAVSLVKVDGERITGRVVRVGDEDIEVRSDSVTGGRQRRHLNLRIPLEAVMSLDRPRDPIGNGLLIGAGIGAGVGLGLMAHAFAVDTNESDEWFAGYVVATVAFAGIGALAGWAIDAAHSKRHFRFQREADGARVRLVPTYAKGPGLAVAVAF